MNRRVLISALSLAIGTCGAFTWPSPASADSLENKKIQVDSKALLEKMKTDGSSNPTAGEVISTPKQKLDASLEAVQIHENDPDVKPDISTSAEVKRPTIAIALGGGGARGAAHIGVLRALAKHNIAIDYIVGNSMGSVVGGLYSAGVSLDDIQQMLYDKSLRKAYMPGSMPQKLVVALASKISHPLGAKHYAGFWKGDKFEKYLKAHLPQPDMNVNETKIPFSAVATNLVDGKAYRISDGTLSRAIRASASIAPLLRPVQIDDKVYCDGGVRANLPCSSAKETGADVVIGVLVDEPLQKMDPKRFRQIKGIAERLTDIVLAVSDERQLEFADVVVNPDVSGVPVLSKKSDDVKKAEKAGELAAEKAMPEILKRIQLAKQQHAVASKINNKNPQ